MPAREGRSVRIYRGEPVHHRRAAATAMLFVCAAFGVVFASGSRIANAATSCTSDPATNTINITIDFGESAGVAVASASGAPDAEAPSGAILLDDNGAGFEGGGGATQCGSATTTNTARIFVLGSDGGERF